MSGGEMSGGNVLDPYWTPLKDTALQEGVAYYCPSRKNQITIIQDIHFTRETQHSHSYLWNWHKKSNRLKVTSHYTNQPVRPYSHSGHCRTGAAEILKRRPAAALVVVAVSDRKSNRLKVTSHYTNQPVRPYSHSGHCRTGAAEILKRRPAAALVVVAV